MRRERCRYACYRLPNLIQLPAPGHLLAIVEGHKHSCADGGWVDVLSTRSSDNGATWSLPTVVLSESSPKVNVTIGNPSGICDETSGRGQSTSITANHCRFHQTQPPSLPDVIWGCFVT